MFAALLWLRLNARNENQRYTATLMKGAGSNWEGIRYIRERLLAYKLVETTGGNSTGLDTRITLHLTKRGEKAEGVARRIDKELRKSASKVKPITSKTKLGANTHPLLVMERGGMWRVVLHLFEQAGDRDARYRRHIEHVTTVGPHGFQDVRERLFDLNLIDEDGVGVGHGARLTYTLRPAGVRVAKLGLEFGDLLGRHVPHSVMPRSRKSAA